MMMTRVSRLVHTLLPLALLSSLVGSIQARQVLASGLARYTSATYGYTLLIPMSWVRIPGVRWTPAGPPADLTLMTADHQAAQGVTVTPTGSRRYSDAELQRVALRLLYQENGVGPTKPETKRVVINGVPFETARSYTFPGAGIYTYSAVIVVEVGVTQRYNRLYALTAVVYLRQSAEPPPGGSAPTPTPTAAGGFGVAPGGEQRNQEEAAAPTPLPPVGLAAVARRLGQGPAGPPPPLPTDHLRGNPCPDASDGGLVIRDKNCAFKAESQAVNAIVSSFRFTPRALADPRPAAPVGVDGFALAADPALGVRVEYPAQWKAVAVPNTNAGLQSIDNNALVTLTVQRTATETLGTSDLQAIADSQIAQVLKGPPPTSSGPVSYQTVRDNGILYLRALAPRANIVPSSGGGDLLAQVNVTVASYHHRVYSLRAIALTFLAINADAVPPAVYPYFTPFTTLARSMQSTAGLLDQQRDLAAQTTWSLFVDPRVLDAP